MFVLAADGTLSEMKLAEFALEADFQQLLEQYPELLSGELIDPEDPRRWLLVSREIPVPGELDGSGWWSADHLFLDQDGVPTIVEVKRQTDQRLRREVVAQMLDYAANGTAYWTAESIRSAFETTCKKTDRDPDQEIQKRLGQDIDISRFWAQVKTNLDAQKVRLLFVADVIPRELRRIVEFLNRQMNPAEVLALELRQYAGANGLRTLAPTLFGQTEVARVQKSGAASGRDWDEDSFFTKLASRSSVAVMTSARLVVAWIDKNTSTGSIWGHGKIEGSVTGYLSVNKSKLYPMMLVTSGKLYITFSECMKPPFDDLAKRQEFLAKLNAIPGLKLPSDCIARQPAIPMDVIAVENRTALLLKVMDWFAEQAVAPESHLVPELKPVP